MDPSAAATTSNSTGDADLASHFLRAVRLRQQDVELVLQQHRRAALAPSREQRDHGATSRQEAAASPLAAFEVTMNPMMQALQTARQFWPQTQPYYSSAQSGGQYQSGPRSSAQQQQPSTLSASAGQYQPQQAVVTASQYHYQPQQAAVTASQYQAQQAVVTASQYQQQQQAVVTASQYQQQQQAVVTASQYQQQQQAVVTASQYQQQQQAVVTASQYQQQQQAVLTASKYQPQQAVFTASQYQAQQAVVTASQYQQPADAPGYGSSFHQRMRAIQAAQAQAMPLRERRCRTLEETRSALLSGAPMELQQLVAFPESAAHVVHLLIYKDAEDHERIRQSVLAGVTRRVSDFIDNKEGHEVLVALLRACTGRHAEVDAIVQAAVAPSHNGRNSLLRSTKHDYWETCVKQLMTAASPYPDLRAMLVDRLLCEGLLENDRGDQLLEHCFATTQHEDAVIVVQCALNKIDAMLVSSSGSKCLVDCYDKATGHQLRAFNEIVLTRAPEIAMGKFSNYFMQHVLEHADGETRQLLVERLMANVVTLSLHNIGSYVVEACYQKARLLPRVLAAFLGLDNDCLVRLVQGKFANYVVHKLLDTAIDRFPRETMVLARRIDGLPREVTDQEYAKKVMKVVRKIFTRYGRMYC